MCARFTLTTPASELAKLFGFSEKPNLPARYNIAPTQDILVVRRPKGLGSPEARMMRWGLVPAWAEDVSIGGKMINARAETVAEKPSYKFAFRTRRALVPMNGMYEWKDFSGKKRPYLFHRKDREPFAVAALWESWAGPKGAPLPQSLETVTLLTVAANELVAPIHDRMAAIIEPPDYATWLAAETAPDALLALLKPVPADALTMTAVNPLVNNVKFDDPACIDPAVEEPVAAAKPKQGSLF
jgi:putative SOS response-associated peptidase YedK